MTGGASILYVNIAGCPQLPSQDALAVFAHNLPYATVSDLNAAQIYLQKHPLTKILVSNHADRALFSAARTTNPNCKNVLVTDLVMDAYSVALGGDEDKLLDHIIAYRTSNNWVNDELRTTLQKIISGDLFGISKYLAPGVDTHAIEITTSGSRDTYNNAVQRFAEECRVGAYLASSLWGICEEMLMNAIYDAPAAAGITRFINIPRTTRIDLTPAEQSTLSFGCDGDYFVVSVRDPFGLMTMSKLGHYAKKILNRHDSENLIDTKAGGAGLGLFKILYSSHGLIFNVDPGKQTEIIAIVEISEQLRDFAKMPRSLHFFST